MPVNPDALALNEAMDEILSRVVGGFEQMGVDLPARQYWNIGQAAADCEQVTVSLLQAYIGPPGDEANSPQTCQSPRTAQFDIQVVRCTPTISGTRGRPPEPAAIQAASGLQVTDAWVLLDIAASLDTWGDGFGTSGVIATIDCPPAGGGFTSTILHLTVAIP